MSLYKKIALMLSVTAVVVLAAVGAGLSNRSADGSDVPPAEQSERESFRQSNSQTPVNTDPVATGDDNNNEANYIADDNMLNVPPFAEEEEVFDFLPSRPGFLKPVFDSDFGGVVDPDEDGENQPAAPADTSADAPETPVPAPTDPEGMTPEISPEAPAASPITEPKPETTKVTTQKKPETTKPVTEAKPEVSIPEGTDLRTAMVAVAESQIGVTEKPYNNVKYNTWYYGHTVCEARKGATRYAWCVVFLSWCADQAGVPQSVFPKIAGVSGLKTFFSNQGRYYKAKGYTPKAGDVVFFGTSHVGVVASVEDGIVTVIEGNYTDSVALTTYKLGSSKLTGYGSPNY